MQSKLKILLSHTKIVGTKVLNKLKQTNKRLDNRMRFAESTIEAVTFMETRLTDVLRGSKR